MKKFILLFLIFFWLSWDSVWAARFYFDVPQRDFYVGEMVPVKILIDTQQESVNTINLKINYPKDYLRVESVSSGNSIINFWVETLAGVVVGGYNGDRGLITLLNFQTLKAGQAKIGFGGASEAYLNDGRGTLVKLNLSNTAVINVISGTPSASISPFAEDKDPPEDFTPVVARAKDVFDDQYFLVFTTQDKGSGVDRYDVQEVSGNKPIDDRW
jgi:hypothetical protein